MAGPSSSHDANLCMQGDMQDAVQPCAFLRLVKSANRLAAG